MDRQIWIDGSRYQPRLSYRMLAEGGVRGVIAKASQGSSLKDPMFYQHMYGAREAGMAFAAYHWLDPMIEVQRQIDNFLDMALADGVDFLAVDVEQYWADWSEWGKKHITKFVPPHKISSAAYVMASALRQTATPVIVYTRTSFVRSYAWPMESWLYRYPLWLAAYPYTKTKVTTTWGELRETWLPKSEPVKPKNVDRWTFWQFSGDKFILPGTYGKVIDLNWFNGDDADYEFFLYNYNLPQPPPVPIGRTLKAKFRLNVRRTPGDMSVKAIVGKLPTGVSVLELERKIVNGNTWILFDGGWVAEIYSGVRLLDVEE